MDSSLKTEQEIKTKSSSVYRNTTPCVLLPPPSGYVALNRHINRNQIEAVVITNGEEEEGRRGKKRGKQEEKKHSKENMKRKKTKTVKPSKSKYKHNFQVLRSTSSQNS